MRQDMLLAELVFSRPRSLSQLGSGTLLSSLLHAAVLGGLAVVNHHTFGLPLGLHKPTGSSLRIEADWSSASLRMARSHLGHDDDVIKIARDLDKDSKNTEVVEEGAELDLQIAVYPDNVILDQQRFHVISSHASDDAVVELDEATLTPPPLARPRRRKPESDQQRFSPSGKSPTRLSRQKPLQYQVTTLAHDAVKANGHNATETPTTEIHTVLPVFTENRPPEYPIVAVQQGWQGTVMLRVTFDREGSVTRVEVSQSSGYPVLDGAAAQAVRDWSARPASRGGRPIEITIQLPIRFEL